jgi:methanogenic corrinoid protein MtbC1
VPVTEAPTQLADHADAYLRALVARDGRAARAAVDAALQAGATVSQVYVEVLQPALYAIGDRWATEACSVADEHFATALTETILGALGPRLRGEPRDGRLAVIACTPDERHALGLRMVSDLLQAEGWEVFELGASLPAADLAALVDEERPDTVLLSTSTAGRLPGIQEALTALRALEDPPLIVVGGQFWTAEAASLARELGADHVVRDARLLVPLLERHLAEQAT